MTAFKTLQDSENEIIVQRSRFLTFVYHIESESEAAARLKELRKKYYDATHVCYGYICDEAGNVQKFSDDGEPSGTAGQPILEAIKNLGYRKVLVVVVRYFGGTKLGAGGLVRAYSESAVACMRKSMEREYILSDIYSVKMEYYLSKKLDHFLSNFVCKKLDMGYNESIELTVAIPVGFDFPAAAAEMSDGRAVITKTGRDFVCYN